MTHTKSKSSSQKQPWRTIAKALLIALALSSPFLYAVSKVDLQEYEELRSTCEQHARGREWTIAHSTFDHAFITWFPETAKNQSIVASLVADGMACCIYNPDTQLEVLDCSWPDPYGVKNFDLEVIQQ